MTTTILETPRLALRSWTHADAEALFEICRDADVMRYIGTGLPFETLEETLRWLDKAVAYEAEHGFYRWAAIERASGEIVGSCGFAHLYGGPEIELGYLYARQHWGRGFATEAAAACLRYGFKEMGLKQIAAIADPQNLASRRVLEKIGFIYQGLRRHNDADDAYYIAAPPPDESGDDAV